MLNKSNSSKGPHILSIRTHILVALNLIILISVLTIGLVMMRFVRNTVIRQVLHQPAENATELVRDMQLPMTDGMLLRLESILELKLVCMDLKRDILVASSLSKAAEKQFNGLWQQSHVDQSRITLEIEAKRYIVYQPATKLYSSTTASTYPVMLFLLSKERLAEETRAVWFQLLPLIGVVLVLTSVLAVVVAHKVTRPLRAFADTMDHLFASRDLKQLKEGEPWSAAETLRKLRQDYGANQWGNASQEMHRLFVSFEELLVRLDKVQKTLKQSSRLATIGELSAVVAHELRNPLSGVKMNIQLMGEVLPEDAESQKMLRYVLEEVARINSFITELLSISRLERASGQGAGGEGAQNERVKLEDVVAPVKTLLQEQMRRNATTLITDIAPDAQYVQVVPEHLRQIVLNLVLNAVDAMPDGGDARLLAVRAGDNVRITVRDNGAGVQVHEDENVFDPLMTTKSNGSGLGLYVCKQLVAYNGGTIGYTNRSEGADFFFELPAPSA